MLNSPMLSIFQHFQVIPLRSPLSPPGSSPDGDPRGFGAFRHLANALLPPPGEVPKAIGACQRYSVLCGIVRYYRYSNIFMQYRYVAPSALRAAPPMGSQEDDLPLNLKHYPDGEPRAFDAFRHLVNALLPPPGEVPKAIGACQRYNAPC